MLVSKKPCRFNANSCRFNANRNPLKPEGNCENIVSVGYTRAAFDLGTWISCCLYCFCSHWVPNAKTRLMMEYGLKDLAILMRWLEVSILKKMGGGGGSSKQFHIFKHFLTCNFPFHNPSLSVMTGPYYTITRTSFAIA